MTRIGLIADTHIPTRAKRLPEKVLETFKTENIQRILHAGDHVNKDVSQKLETIAPVTAVKGNMDWNVPFPTFQSLQLENKKIGLYHGGGVRPPGDPTLLKEFASERDVDILVTGHTHSFFVKKLDGILLINPGSPTNPQGSKTGSFAILNPETEEVTRYQV